MDIGEIKAALGRIHDEIVEGPGGVAAAEMWRTFNDEFPDAKNEVGASLFDGLGHRLCREVIGRRDRAAQQQLDLGPQFGVIANMVTVQDGEGGFRHKLIRFASSADLHEDVEINRANAVGAFAALRRSEHTAAVLVPVMDEHGFETAGQAIEYLTRSAS